nr:hypothetical protein [Variovorax boronicumulans]
MRSGASGTVIADFVGNNFDHGPLGYVGGAFIGETKSHGRPIEFHPVPPGTPALGLELKLPWHGTTTTPWCSTCTAVPWRRAAMTWTWTRLSATPGACRCCA